MTTDGMSRRISHLTLVRAATFKNPIIKLEYTWAELLKAWLALSIG